MNRAIFESKCLAAAILILFTALWVGEGFAQAANQEQSEFTRAFETGKKLYEDGEHKEAVIKFLQALNAAKEKAETGEACFYLSLSYYGLGDAENTTLYMKKMFEAQPEREINARMFPSGYVVQFYRIKSDFAPQKPAKAEEKKADLEKKAEEEVKKPTAVPGKAAAEPQVKKKGKFPWLIVGGLVVAAGVVLYLVLSKKKDSVSNQGSISIVSTPSGAKVFLDGNDTGQTTACTLSNVSVGSHAVKLTKDGYTDYQQNVTVTGGQTAAVNAAMTANIIVVTSPGAGTAWKIGTANDIRWQVDSGALAAAMRAKSMPRGREKLGERPGHPEIPPKPAEDAVRAGRSTRAGGMPEKRVNNEESAPDPRLPLSPESPLRINSSQVIVKVKIELYKGGALHSLIIAEVDNNGVYSWLIPQSSVAGSDYKIRVSCSTDTSIYGESGLFQIGSGSSSSYEFVQKWGNQGSGDGQLYFPSGIDVDSSDFLYIADQYNNRIVRSTSYGFVMAKWGSLGSGNGQFWGPWDIVIDPSKNSFVADNYNHRVQKFYITGAFMAGWGGRGSNDGQFSFPTGIALDSAGNVYVTDSDNHRIQKFTAAGTFLSKWGSRGSGDGQFSTPYGIAVDGADNIYVVEFGNHRVQKFTAAGTFVAKWGSQGTGDGQFDSPQGIAVDGSGNVFVTDTNNNRIQKFTSNGTFVTKWGTGGTGDGQFAHPHGIVVSGTSHVFVADTENHRIQEFRPKASAPLLALFERIFGPLAIQGHKGIN